MAGRRIEAIVERELKYTIALDQLRDQKAAEARAEWETTRFDGNDQLVKIRQKERELELEQEKQSRKRQEQMKQRKIRLQNLFSQEKQEIEQELRACGLAKYFAY